MTAATLILCALLLAALLWRERDHEHALAQLADAHAKERDTVAKRVDLERQVLLNRIKPETAQYVPSDTQLWAPPAVHPDIDEEYWESKEELAERLAAEETA